MVTVKGIVIDGFSVANKVTDSEEVKKIAASWIERDHVPGTLNIWIDTYHDLLTWYGIRGKPWKTHMQNDGWPLHLHKAELMKYGIVVAVSIFSHFYPTGLVELLAPDRLREHQGLKTGDPVQIDFYE